MLRYEWMVHKLNLCKDVYILFLFFTVILSFANLEALRWTQNGAGGRISVISVKKLYGFSVFLRNI